MYPSYGACKDWANEQEEAENDGDICEDEQTIRTDTTDKHWEKEECDFKVWNLREGLLQRIMDSGLDNPTPFQQKAGTEILKGNDVIIETWSETEINAVTSILALQNVDLTLHQCQVLIITLTEEMAEKVKYAVVHLGTDMQVLCHAYHTGHKLKEDKERANEVAHVIVGTPGRLHEMINQNLLIISEIRLFALQMAEKTLSRNSESVVYSIFEKLSQNLRVLVWSRTLEEQILCKCKRLVRDAHVIIKEKHKIHHLFLPVMSNMQRMKFLINLRDKFNLTNAIVFRKTKQNVRKLKKNMKLNDFEVSVIDSEVAKQGNVTAGKFHLASDSTPITTNLVRRIFGKGIPVMINYDSPKERNYFDRMNRINLTEGVVIISFISLKKKERMESCMPRIALILPVYGYYLPLCKQPNYEPEGNIVGKSRDAFLCQGDEERAENIRHIFIPHAKGPQEFTVLNNLYDRLGIKRAVIFCDRTRGVNRLIRNMEDRKFSVLALRSPISIEQRNTILKEFNSADDKTLITSDLLEDCNITHVQVVIFYDFQEEQHKRFLGVCRSYSMVITFYTGSETKHDIVNAAGTEMQELLICDENNVRCCVPGSKLFDETFHLKSYPE